MLSFLSIAAGSNCPAQLLDKSFEVDVETSSLDEPVQLPPDVLRVVLRSAEEELPSDLRCEKQEQDSDEPKPEILCGRIPLSASGENFLVLGVGSLRSPHAVEMWLIRKDRAGVSLLFRGSADQFTFGPKWTKGFLNLEADHLVGGVITSDSYRFKNGRYLRTRHETQELQR